MSPVCSKLCHCWVFSSIVSVSQWTTDSLDNILWCGDKLYKSISKTTDLLQVNDIGPKIFAFQNTYNFCIEHEFLEESEKINWV